MRLARPSITAPEGCIYASGRSMRGNRNVYTRMLGMHPVQILTGTLELYGNGQPLCVGWPWHPGFAAPGWRTWKRATSMTATPNAIKAGLSNDTICRVML